LLALLRNPRAVGLAGWALATGWPGRWALAGRLPAGGWPPSLSRAPGGRRGGVVRRGVEVEQRWKSRTKRGGAEEEPAGRGTRHQWRRRAATVERGGGSTAGVTRRGMRVGAGERLRGMRAEAWRRVFF